jgi:hypothetical protein
MRPPRTAALGSQASREWRLARKEGLGHTLSGGAGSWPLDDTCATKGHSAEPYSASLIGARHYRAFRYI